MLTLIVDQFEFDNPSTEERLEIAVSKRTEFPHADLRAFVDCLGATLSSGEAAPLTDLHGSADIRTYLSRFAGLQLAGSELAYRLRGSDPDEDHVVIDAGDRFISYRWSTSA